MTTFIAWGNIRQPFPFEQIPAELLSDSLRLPPNDNARVRQRWQCRRLAHFLLWHLCKTAEIPTALLGQISRTLTGRPQFPVTHIDFNISHSGDWVAVILNVSKHSDESQPIVGIDIELHKTHRNLTALLTHFATQSELDWFASQQDQTAAFYRCWCVREALLKSQGVGIAKLSEVSHSPQLDLLHSAHCPRGRLLFSAELPFYLAAFAAGEALEDARFLSWNGEEMETCSLKSAVSYLVNF